MGATQIEGMSKGISIEEVQSTEKAIHGSFRGRRVLLVADHFYPFRGGLEAFCLNIAQRLKRDGCEVSVLTYQYDKSLPLQQTHEGIEIYRIPAYEVLKNTYCYPKLFNAHTKKTLHHLSSHRWDAVITNTRFFTSCAVGQRVAKKSESVHIHIEHGNQHVVHPNTFVQIGAYIYDLFVGARVIRKSDAIVTISSAGEKFVQKLDSSLKSKGVVTIIHNSVDTSSYVRVSEEQMKELREKHSIAPNDFVILFIGRLIMPKGVTHLINIIDNIAGGKLFIIGDGPYLSELRHQAKDKRVVFLGSVNADICRQYMSIADCFVNPSYSEGIPTTILEAASVGVPVVATNVGGTSEIIPDLRFGILVPAKDDKALLAAILQIQNNKVLVKKITGNLHDRVVEQFDWDANVQKLENLIATLSDKRSNALVEDAQVREQDLVEDESK
jgi:glycosyltransferase involved in cell wall biosynthesis